MKASHFLVFITLLFLSQTIPAIAGFWYVLDKNNTIVGKVEEEPKNVTSLESREEKLVQSDLDLKIEDAVISKGAIKERKKSDEEEQVDKAKEEFAAEDLLIYRRARKLAVDSLIAEGKVFKRVSDFGS